MTVTTAPLALRPYQRDAVDAIVDAIGRGVRRPAVVLPTGAGKTVVFAHLPDEREIADRGRMLVLAHREELIEQAAAKIRAIAPHRRVGVVKADRDEVGADVIVASVQTLRSERRRSRVRGIGTIVVDECHHATAPTYRAILEHYGALDGPRDSDTRAVAVGFTATMARGDGTALGGVWQDIVYSRDIATMIREGHLVGARGVRVMVPNLDLRKVKRSRGDYADGALGEALEGSLAPELVAAAYREHAPDLPGILFAPTVATAYAFGQALEAEGFTVGVIHGELPSAERRQRLQDFRDGKIQILSNCMVLTEGTDLPMACVCVVARPTGNHSLYVQMVGRVLRPYPGKDRALVLDVVGASVQHTLMSPVRLFGEEPKLVREERELDDDELDDDALDLDNETEAVEVGGIEQIWLSGDIESVEVDLFHGSSSSWLRTHAGIWFVPAGDRLVCIFPAPEPGEYDVLWMHKHTRGLSGWVARGVGDLGYAMAYAEGNVTTEEHGTAAKERTWRATRPSEAQTAYAARLGVAIVPGMTKGEASNLISVAAASVRIDPYLPPHVRRG